MVKSDDAVTVPLAAPLEVETSKVVTTVTDAILAAIGDGSLLPGQRLSDAKLAESLGVSRTPVREAFQRLREIGIIEASASRFTRVAVVSAQRTADTLVVWLALMHPLVAEVVPAAPPELAETMREQHDAFLRATAARDVLGIAASNVAFWSAPAAHSANGILQYTLNSSIQLLRLGGLTLRGWIDFERIVAAQQKLLAAVGDRDAVLAHDAIRELEALTIPLR